MKKAFLFIMLSFLCVPYIQAQKMTDDQVVEYVLNAQEKGDNQQQIASALLHRGVTMDQINRIRRKMNSKNSSGIGMTLEKKERTRKDPLKKDDPQFGEEGDNIGSQMQDGVASLMLPDSTAMQDEMKNRKKISIIGRGPTTQSIRYVTSHDFLRGPTT